MRRPQNHPLIEPLESRIAPAGLILIANTFASVSSSKTQTLQFINAGAAGLSASNAAIAATVGDNPDVFFIKVGPGDDVKVPNTVGYPDLINVTAGTVVAFFTDPTGKTTDAVLSTELSGLALGNKTSVVIHGGVYGDIVTNYNDSTGTIGPGLLANKVTSLSVDGPITGSFIAGANVSRLFVTGSMNEILTGHAADGYSFSFVAGTTTGMLSVPVPAPKVAGPSISNVVVGSVNTIQLGVGGTGAAGGSVSGLTLLGDVFGFTVQAGAGGAGGPGKTTGGTGGSISNVVIQGPSSADGNVNAPMILLGGAGGNGAGNAVGGAGGAVQNVFVDYTNASTVNPSQNLLTDDVTIHGGAGGTGGKGGAGGGLANINVLLATPHDPSATAPEFQLLGGAGGVSPTGGKGGHGGSINNVLLENDALPPIDPTTLLPDDTAANSPTNVVSLIEAGAGGSLSGTGAGGVGGSIGNLTLRGYNFEILAGAGGTGAISGGAGGSIGTLNVLGSSGSLPGDNYHAETLNILAGGGGNGGTGKGGAGGSVNGVTIQNADFGAASFPAENFVSTGLQLTSGTGGNSGKGAGGPGGNVSGVNVTDTDFVTLSHPYGNSGMAMLTAGSGGNATGSGAKGGVGGSLSNVTVVGTRLIASVASGTGGNGGLNAIPGKGGAGGNITQVAIRAAEDLYINNLTTTSQSAGLLVDSTATFDTDGVAVGDIVENTTTGATTTVTVFDSPTQLELASDIFAAGDNYLVAVPNSANYTGTAGDSQDTIIDNSVNFVNEGVIAGDVVEDVTDTNNDYTPVTATVVSVAAHVLTLTSGSSDISHVGDQYAFTVLGGIAAGTASSTTSTILVANENFVTEGITPGTLVEDVTATNANGGVPVTAVVAAGGVTAHSLTVSNPYFGAVGDQYSFPALGSATFTGGSGGSGVLTGAGGKGGSVVTSSAVVPGTVTFVGGNGGSSLTAAGGAGGSLNGDGAFSSMASGFLRAGTAGSGGKAAAGGGVSGANVQALENVSIYGGAGASGGAGGSVLSSGFSGVLQDGAGFNPPAGNIIVQAGGGSSSTTGNGGAGGSINTLTGFISSGDGVDPFTTAFNAGGGGNGVNKAGAGGSVSNIRIFGGGGADVTFYINAGDAGNASSGKVGAAGGSVTNIGGGAESSSSGDPNFSISPLTDFNYISAGYGGNAVVKGGLGGSVSHVYVNASIGERTGASFGFDLTGMGGISAGLGGSGSTPGVNGSVTDIAADAIASIVAGRLTAGTGLRKTNLATKVDGIILNAQNPPSVVHQFVLTFGGDQTVVLPTNATPVQVASALNALASISAAGGVTVTMGLNDTYIVTFKQNGAQSTISGAEPASSPDGTVTQVQLGVLPVYPPNPNPVEGVEEEQTIQVSFDGPFTLSFEGQSSPLIPTNATPYQVETALNEIPAIVTAGDVYVEAGTNGSGTGPGYTVIFENYGPQPLISAPAYAPYSTELVQGDGFSQSEMQNVQDFNSEPFTLTFNGQTTTILAGNDTAQNVQNALDALSNNPGPGNFTVTAVAPTATNPNPSYNITFPGYNPEPLIIPNLLMNAAGSGGTSNSPSVQTLSFPVRGDIDPVQYGAANFVGSIVNILQANATTFHYQQLVAGTGFQFGDAPIDGLIAASTLTAFKNFVPEAFVTLNPSGNGTADLIDNQIS